jgi:PhnB protein
VLMRHGDHGVPLACEGMRGKVMHSRFEGPGLLFFASDNHDAEPMRGSAHMLILDNRATTDRLFTALADGGEITTHLAVQPWGSYYGKLTDRFSVQWMLDCLSQTAG